MRAQAARVEWLGLARNCDSWPYTTARMVQEAMNDLAIRMYGKILTSHTGRSYG